MELLLERDTFTESSTTGILYLEKDAGDSYEYQDICFILEDKCREEFGKPETFVKVYGETAIPYGRYKIVIVYVEKFVRSLPLLLDVPHYSGILIHSGNKAEDTLGCLITGTTRQQDWVSASKVAFDKVFPMIKLALDNGEEVWITISKKTEA